MIRSSQLPHAKAVEYQKKDRYSEACQLYGFNRRAIGKLVNILQSINNIKKCLKNIVIN